MVRVRTETRQTFLRHRHRHSPTVRYGKGQGQNLFDTSRGAKNCARHGEKDTTCRAIGGLQLSIRAHTLFNGFQGRPPIGKELAILECEKPREILQVGPLDGVIYTALGDGQRYIHQFTKTRRPLLYVTADGAQAIILGGGYRFTDRGFVG